MISNYEHGFIITITISSKIPRDTKLLTEKGA